MSAMTTCLLATGASLQTDLVVNEVSWEVTEAAPLHDLA